jgi:hypothetical protein
MVWAVVTAILTRLSGIWSTIYSFTTRGSKSRKMINLFEEVLDEVTESVIGLIIGFVALF